MCPQIILKYKKKKMEEKESTKNNLCLRSETKIKTPKLDQK